MRLYYITLNTTEEAERIGRALLERRLAVCVNWFPITCAYRWEGGIVQEPEVVLIVKTRSGFFEAIEEVLREHITYTNFVAELTPEQVNAPFLRWLHTEVPPYPIKL
jgi:periplasmic divalent cation tolerance protein